MCSKEKKVLLYTYIFTEKCLYLSEPVPFKPVVQESTVFSYINSDHSW